MGLSGLAEDLVDLPPDLDEGGALGQVLETLGADVGTRRSHAAEDLLDRGLDGTTVREEYDLALRSPVLGHSAGVLLHGLGRAHAVELHEALFALGDDLTTALVVTREHAADHHEVRTTTERLADVAGHGAASVTADLTVQAVRGVGALDDRGELRVADAGHLARRAHRTRADAHLDDVHAAEDERLGHLGGDHIARHDDELGVLTPNLLHEAEERLAVAVGDIDADHPHRTLGLCDHALELGVVLGGDTRGEEDAHAVFLREPLEEACQLLRTVVLVEGRRDPVLEQGLGHLEGGHRVHVGGHDRHARVHGLGVRELDLPHEVNLRTRPEPRTLGDEEDVGEVELGVFDDTHENLDVAYLGDG